MSRSRIAASTTPAEGDVIQCEGPVMPVWLRWDHNAYYHRWLLRQVPHEPQRVLEVGCGAGALACRLAERGALVDAVDRSPLMIQRAAARCPDRRVRWLLGDVLDADLPLAAAGFDVVTAVASLHHLPLEPGLARLAGLVRPGGLLAVVGLYRPQTLVDRAVEALAVPANVAVGLGLTLTGRSGRPDDVDMPILPPQTALSEIARAVAGHLPGARLQRGLFWRYLLTWRRPA